MKSLLILLISIYLLMLGYVYLAQRSFIYFPGFTRPAAFPTNYELENDGFQLKGWMLNEGGRDAIIYFGGNGESVEYNLPMFRKIFKDTTVYMLAYRGYGNSEGNPTEEGLYSDALAMYDKIHTKHSSTSIIGRSLGSAVATYVAANRPTERLALITPFASLENLARRQFLIFPVGLLLKDKYQSAKRVKQIKANSLIIYAENDQIIPEASTKKIIAEFAPDRIKVKKIKGAGHNSISDFEGYRLELEGFFNRAD